jgi:transcription termination/antitermination protein NusG
MSDTDMTHIETTDETTEPPTDDTPTAEAEETPAEVEDTAIEVDETPTEVETAATDVEDTATEVDETPTEVEETVEGEEQAAAGELATDEDEGPDEEEEPAEPSPWLRPGQWFVVHTQSGYEKKVKSNLEARIQSMNMEEKIFEVVIPMEDVVEFKGGRKQVVQRKVFPGYLLVRCEMDDSSWYVIRNTPGVTGFVGQGRFGQKPTPLSRREVDTFLSAKGDGAEAPRHSKPKLEYDVGESVRVKEGPFADFTGSVAEINVDHLKLKVLVNIFGRETLVEMDFSQVAKI